MNIILGEIAVNEADLNKNITLMARNEKPVESILATYNLTVADIAPIEVRYLRERVKDVLDGKILQKSWY